MGTTAKLTIILKADDTVVAESDDAALWQGVLSSIHGGTPLQPTKTKTVESPQDSEEAAGDSDKFVANLAKRLGVSVDAVVGALMPSRVEPYLELDQHCWASMKKNTPERGPGALSATGLAGTLLALWLKEAKLDVQPTQALVRDVLASIHIRDPNPGRGIRNTRWLQGRAGGVVVINPAEIIKAIEVARAFCTKEWTGGTKSA